MSTYETVVVVGMALWILIALGLLVGLLYLLSILRAAREPLSRISGVVEALEDRLQPVIRNVERASEDVNYIVASVRSDLGEVGDAVRHATDSTHRMLQLAEERAAELSGLLEVVQEEAESTFLSTASLLRGIRGGRDAGEAERRGNTLGSRGRHE